MNKLKVINAYDIVAYSTPGDEKKYVSRLLIDAESVGSTNLVLNHFTLFPGASTYLGSHPVPYEEVYYILSGRGVLLLGDDGSKHNMTANTVAFIPAGTPHQITNVGEEPLEMLTMMPFHPEPGANSLYDERKREWGTSFRRVSSVTSPGSAGDDRDGKQ